MIKFLCRHCGQKIKVPIEYVSQKVRCPACSATFVVPDPKMDPVGCSWYDPTGSEMPNEDRADIWSDELIHLSQVVQDEQKESSENKHDNYYNGPKCPQCGNPLTEELSVCTRCGSRIQSPSKSQVQKKVDKTARDRVPERYRLPLAVILSFWGAMIGGIAWAALGHFAHLEAGSVAIGIGILAGTGASIIPHYSIKLGIFATSMALLGILAGKLIMIHWSEPDFARDIRDNPPENWIEEMVNDEQVLFKLAIEDLHQQRALTTELKDQLMDCYIHDKIDQTPDLRAGRLKVLGHINKWDDQTRHSKARGYIQQHADEIAGGFVSEKSLGEKLWKSLGRWDFLWFLLAAGSAFKIATRHQKP